MNPNIAGVRREVAEETCRRELRVAGIPEKAVGRGVDVDSRVGGELAGVTFTRAWYYWVANGRVPLAAAKKLYADPAGPDVRVDGDCGRPAPEGRHVKWFAPCGREVLPVYERQECERYAAGDSPVMKEIAARILAEHLFSDDPAGLGAEGFVTLYHIDSEVGLRVFADAIRSSACPAPGR